MVEDVEEAVVIEEVLVRVAVPTPENRKRDYERDVVQLLAAAETEQHTEKEKVHNDDSTCETAYDVRSNQAQYFRNAKDELGCTSVAHHRVSDEELSMGRDSPATTRTESSLSHIGYENEIIIEEFLANVTESFCTIMLCEGFFSNRSNKKKIGKKYYDDDDTCFTAATGYSTVASIEEVLLKPDSIYIV